MKRVSSIFLASIGTLLSVGCTIDSSAPIDYPEYRYRGSGFYRNAALDSGGKYFPYGAELRVELKEAEIPARCLLADLRIGHRDAVAPFGTDGPFAPSPEAEEVWNEVFHDAAAYRKSDSSAFFLYEWVIDGEVDQSCAFFPPSFDTLLTLSTAGLAPIRKLYILGWNDVVIVPGDSGVEYQPRLPAVRDSIELRWGSLRTDTLRFATDSLRKITSFRPKTELVRLPAGESKMSGILRKMVRECRVDPSPCTAWTDTLYRLQKGAQDTLFKVVKNGDYLLVEEAEPGEKEWDHAYRVLRGDDTVLVRQLGSSDTIVLDTLSYVLRGGDTTLIDTVSEAHFLLETILRRAAPDTVDQIRRTSCIDGTAWCSSLQAVDRVLSAASDTSTITVPNWQTVLMEKGDLCDRINRTRTAEHKDPASNEQSLLPKAESRFVIEYFLLDPKKENCADGGAELRGWILPSWRAVTDPDSLAAWWTLSGEEP